MFRFFFGSLYRHRQFSGDPHPGNFLLLDDGRMAFLDFGLFKRMSDEAVEFELTCQRAYIDGDGETLMRLFVEHGFISRRMIPRFCMSARTASLTPGYWTLTATARPPGSVAR